MNTVIGVYFTTAFIKKKQHYEKQSYIYLYTYFFQFNDDKDDREIRKVGEIKCPEAYPWQTIETEDEGKTREVCYRSAFSTIFSCQI